MSLDRGYKFYEESRPFDHVDFFRKVKLKDKESIDKLH